MARSAGGRRKRGGARPLLLTLVAAVVLLAAGEAHYFRSKAVDLAERKSLESRIQWAVGKFESLPDPPIVFEHADVNDELIRGCLELSSLSDPEMASLVTRFESSDPVIREGVLGLTKIQVLIALVYRTDQRIVSIDPATGEISIHRQGIVAKGLEEASELFYAIPKGRRDLEKSRAFYSVGSP